MYKVNIDYGKNISIVDDFDDVLERIESYTYEHKVKHVLIEKVQDPFVEDFSDEDAGWILSDDLKEFLNIPAESYHD